MSLTVEEKRDVLYAIKHFQNHHISPSTDRYTYFTHILEKIEHDDENISGLCCPLNYREALLLGVD